MAFGDVARMFGGKQIGVRALAVTAISIVACGGGDSGSVGSSGSSSATGGGSSSGNSGTSASSGTSGSTGSGTSSSGAGGASPLITPIARADAWVDGWYGSTTYRGVNVYDHTSTPGAPGGYYTEWRGDPGVTLYANVTDCSSFADVLLSRSYGWLPPTVHPRPLAEDYYWAVRNGVHFMSITNANAIAIGDVIAILYGTADSGGDTGHIMWVDAAPVAYAASPAEPGLTQLAVTIIDSSHGFHYAPASDPANQDTRYLGAATAGDCTTDADCTAAYGANAVCNSWTLTSKTACAYSGVGRGRMRLYVDAAGAISGYAWSTNSGSTFYAKPSPQPVEGAPFSGRDVVIGRYVGG